MFDLMVDVGNRTQNSRIRETLLFDVFSRQDRGKENDIFARNLINRPYGTGRVFLLFSRHFVPGYLRFDPSGINA